MAKEYDDYLKFVDSALEIAKKIPKYFSKYSNHIYCNHQIIFANGDTYKNCL